MGKASLLDCTLRDGAYIVDKTFGDTVIRGIINGLVEARMDYIEIGFLQDTGFGEGKTVFLNAQDAQRFIPQEKGVSEFAILADCSRYSVDNLEDCTGTSFSIVRECFFKHECAQAMENCRKLKEKGYKVFVQSVDILGYSDQELLELIASVNQVEPYCFSIVDTFGSMYEEDLQHVYSIIDHNLVPGCKIGFHSHNNLQMSSALSQAFLRMAHGKREVVVDGTISGMGRGAGNTPTELIAQYMANKLGYNYNMDALLDVIDGYMDNIRSRCTWGYSTPLFLAGCYSSHVNIISYLSNKSSIRSRDIRFILNQMDSAQRKRYPYDVVEQTYLEYMSSNVDDSEAISELKKIFSGRKVVVIAPGKTASQEQEKIRQVIQQTGALSISVNFVHDAIRTDYVYMGNVKRYQYWSLDPRYLESRKILTSNIPVDETVKKEAYLVSFASLVKCGWEHLDNSTILLLRLLDKLEVEEVFLAGLDGYSLSEQGTMNYASKDLELSNVKDNPIELNIEIEEMLADYMVTKTSSLQLRFITPSRFEGVLENRND